MSAPIWPRSSPRYERIARRRIGRSATLAAVAVAISPRATLRQRSRWPQRFADRRQARPGQARAGLALCARTAVRNSARRTEMRAAFVRAACYVAAGAHPDLRLIEPLLSDEEGNAHRRRCDHRRSHSRAHRIHPTVDPSSSRQGRGDRAGRSDERRRRQRLAQNARGAAGGHLSDAGQPSDRARLPATIISRCQRLSVPEPDFASAVGVAQGARRRPTPIGCWRRPAARLCWRSSSPIRLLQRECASLLAELARPERLSPVAIGARLDAAREGRAQAAACRGGVLAADLDRRPCRRWSAADRRAFTRRRATRWRRWRRGWRGFRCSAIISRCCGSARCLRIRCSRGWSRRRC